MDSKITPQITPPKLLDQVREKTRVKHYLKLPQSFASNTTSAEPSE